MDKFFFLIESLSPVVYSDHYFVFILHLSCMIEFNLVVFYLIFPIPKDAFFPGKFFHSKKNITNRGFFYRDLKRFPVRFCKSLYRKKTWPFVDLSLVMIHMDFQKKPKQKFVNGFGKRSERNIYIIIIIIG